MKHGQTRYLLKIVLFIKCQDFRDAIVFHYDAVDDVPHPGMIFENVNILIIFISKSGGLTAPARL
jgi:hypothetical protein